MIGAARNVEVSILWHDIPMPNKPSKFAEVSKKSKEKRAEANTRTAARKAAELKEDISQAAARMLREGKRG